MKKNNTTSPLLEACVETLEQAILAEKNGAHRIELCADLSVGGLTPSRELITTVRQQLNIPVMVIIRPTPGGFVYTEPEIEEMKQAIDFCKKIKVAGVVLGILTLDNEIDAEKTKALVDFAQPLQVTFHKAVDETTNPVRATETLMQIPGIQRILTSGGAPTALEGKEVLKKMIAVS
jgi:copper homeostasis protein